MPKKKKPDCYGQYWDRAPTAANLEKRGCLGCEFWTLDEDGCCIRNMPKIPATAEHFEGPTSHTLAKGETNAKRNS